MEGEVDGRRMHGIDVAGLVSGGALSLFAIVRYRLLVHARPFPLDHVVMPCMHVHKLMYPMTDAT